MPSGALKVGPLAAIGDPGCREFTLEGGERPLYGFVVRQGDDIFAYENVCAHAGQPLNWKPDAFLTKDGNAIQCVAHGATYRIETGECFAGPCRGRALNAIFVEVRDGEVWVRRTTKN